MISRIATATLLFGLGCSTSALCADAAGPIDAAEPIDSPAPIDAAAAPRLDAGACDGFSAPIAFGFWLVSDGTTTTTYAASPDAMPMHLEIRARGEMEPLIVQDGPLAAYFGTSTRLPPGDYELSASVGAFAIGAERWVPCDSAQPSCPIVPFTVACGGSAGGVVALYCDPSRGACPAVTWPWAQSP